MQFCLWPRRSDTDIVMAAIAENWSAFEHASFTLLQSDPVINALLRVPRLRVLHGSLLPGRSVFIAVSVWQPVPKTMDTFRRELSIPDANTVAMAFGFDDGAQVDEDDVTPLSALFAANVISEVQIVLRAVVPDWPSTTRQLCLQRA